jgi:hypothetical protein
MECGSPNAGATLLQTSLSVGSANITAFAGQRGGQLVVALINKDSMPAHIAIDRKSIGGANLRFMASLSAPSLDARSGVVFEALNLTPDELAKRMTAGIDVPPYTALLLRFTT